MKNEKPFRMAILLAVCAVSLSSLLGGCARLSCADEFAIPAAEYARYHKAITGRDAPDGAVRFAIDPLISKTGNDAYSIKSVPGGVRIVGSNMRSVMYAVYDLLERRGGCHWFWDGDIVPKKDAIYLADLDVFEEARFEYRGLRYFAHRGLTRFQAEHWGLDDWKKEIDWCLKRRLNVFMLRIGQDDLFQRTFPDIVSYPDPSKPLPGAGKGYDNRTLFWSLQYRGKLRQDLQNYAFDRGMMIPEDFGTMTHWYSRTPEDFLEKMNPPFLPQATRGYAEKNGLVWDIRQEKWADEYWKLTKTAVKDYNRPGPGLLHTIGLGERRCFTNRQDNFNLKLEALGKFLSRAHRDYPDSKVLLAGWDFFFTWHPDEVKALVQTLDPKRDIIWDYEGDATRDYRAEMQGLGNNFTKWGVVGKFPYTYSVFLAFEDALDTRANYPLIEKRQKIVQNDPFCKGYIFWPESSHTDTLLLRHFTANAWSSEGVGIDKVLPEFCASRYGERAATFKPIWDKVLPISQLLEWGGNYGKTAGLSAKVEDAKYWLDGKYRVLDGSRLAAAPAIFKALGKLDWKETQFTERDAIDLARVTADRAIIHCHNELMKSYYGWTKGGVTAAKVRDLAALYVKLGETMRDLLALHTDYSIWESYLRLDKIEKIVNPDFEHVLVDNASCGYCASHQYELADNLYLPQIKRLAERIEKHLAKDDKSALEAFESYEERRAPLLKRSLKSMAPTLPRTQENYVKTMKAVEELVAPLAR